MSRRYLHPHVHGSIIYNSQDVETKCPFTDTWLKKMWCIYTQWNTTQPLKKKTNKETLPFLTTWMELVGSMLSEISQTENDKYCMISLVYGFKKNIDKKTRFVAAGRGGLGRANWIKALKGCTLLVIR